MFRSFSNIKLFVRDEMGEERKVDGEISLSLVKWINVNFMLDYCHQLGTDVTGLLGFDKEDCVF